MASENQHVVLAMPSPSTLRAPAVWITARSWALAVAERFGDARVVTPDGSWAPSQLTELIDSMLSGTAGVPRRRSRLVTEVRTFAKDIRISARHAYGSRRTDGIRDPSQPFVWQHHDFFFTLGSRLARAADLPLVQFVDAPHVWEARRWGVSRSMWGRVLERAGEVPQLKEADLVVCVSEGVAEAVQEIVGRTTRVVVTPCTADPLFFSDSTEREAVRQRLGFADSDVIVGWTGSFRRFHAVEQLINAFAQIDELGHGVELVLIGDGPDRQRLEELASRSPASDAITFTGQIPYSQMRDHVAALDVAVLTAREDAEFHYSPLKLREYRASGRAIIAPHVGQVAATLTDGGDALLYPAGDINLLSAHIQSLASDAALRARLGAASRADELARGGTQTQVDLVLAELR